MDTNSRLYFQSVQFNGIGVVSGLLASPCCPVWYGRFILFYIGFSILYFKKLELSRGFPFKL